MFLDSEHFSMTVSDTLPNISIYIYASFFIKVHMSNDYDLGEP